jgi:DNA polymerase III subunit gamma/tau
MSSLAVRYRPKTFEEVCGQSTIIKILQKQIESDTFKHVYLFCGPTGCGKTTLARIFANEINRGVGEPIEIDGASNNGVDNVKAIIQEAQERAIDGEYKVFIIDECHAITTQGWQAFLKTLEEPPAYSIFILCTTDAQKVPPTIKNRVQCFNLSRIKTEDIKSRLTYICSQDPTIINYNDSIDYISKISNGGLRDAISMLEKALDYSHDLIMDNVLKALGISDYTTFFNLTDAIVDGKEAVVLNIIDNYYDNGGDLKLFIDTYLTFILDLTKYCMFKDMAPTRIPSSMEEKVKYTTGIENNIKYFTHLTDLVLDIKNNIRYDSNNKTTVEIMLIQACRCA